MTKNAFDAYCKMVAAMESGLAPHAKKSFEPFSPLLVDGSERAAVFGRQLSDPSASARYSHRTPLQLERDRILYSPGLRIQTEKYHVLYNGRRRIVRNYTTHTLKMTQVAKAICRALRLNGDFAEAIALGSKVGALPFIHASKRAVSRWIQDKVVEIDAKVSKTDAAAKNELEQLTMSFKGHGIPAWIRRIQSKYVLERVASLIPWAAGAETDLAYNSGQQGYWQLALNPYTLQSKGRSYSPETMYGVWRHTRGQANEQNSFWHCMRVPESHAGKHDLNCEHATYEGIVVQFSDDITWIIENLTDAHHAALLNNKLGIFNEVAIALGQDADGSLLRAVVSGDSGGLYSYFINDFAEHSERVLKELGDDSCRGRIALRKGEANASIGLSPTGLANLEKLERFLFENVFKEDRVKHRFEMLQTVSEACVNLLYNGEEILRVNLEERALLERWTGEQLERAKELLRDDVHRVQLAVNMYADMGDQEIYEFIGIQSL